MKLHSRRSGPSRRGGLIVEFALVVPLLLLLTFAALEFGLVVRDLLTMNQAAREGARIAALGAATHEVGETVLASAPGLNADSLTVVSEYRVYSTSGAGEWRTLQTVGDPPTNNAGPGSQVRVRLVYSHTLATGGLVARLMGVAQDNEVELRAQNATRRE